LWGFHFANEVSRFVVEASYKAKHIWDGVIEKIKRQLASWKMIYLSKDGRVTLIKSIPLPIFLNTLSLFPLPASVAKSIEKLQCDFLWGGWCSLELTGVFGVGLWKNIKKGLENFSCHTNFEVGDGFRICFGMIIGAGMWLLKQLFQFCLVLLV
jgi:hypothetical protein